MGGFILKTILELKYLQCPFGVQGIFTREAQRAEFDGVGLDGNQMCPSMFFILCKNLEHVYTYLIVYKKIVTNMLMGFKI